MAKITEGTVGALAKGIFPLGGPLWWACSPENLEERVRQLLRVQLASEHQAPGLIIGRVGRMPWAPFCLGQVGPWIYLEGLYLTWTSSRALGCLLSWLQAISMPPLKRI